MLLAIPGAGAAEDPVAAAKEVMLKLKKMVLDSKSGRQLRFTAALTDGRTIYAFRNAVYDSANTLYYRANRDGTVIASEPLDAGRDPDSGAREPCLDCRAGYGACDFSLHSRVM